MTNAVSMAEASFPQCQFGVHEIEGTLYLFQDTCPDGVALVEPENRQKFMSRRNTDLASLGGQCTHNLNPFAMRSRIPKHQWESFMKLANDPLVQAFLPVPAAAKSLPKNKVYLVDGRFNGMAYLVLKNLERLCSPVHSRMKPFSRMTEPYVLSELAKSNIHPITLQLKNSEDECRSAWRLCTKTTKIPEGDENRPLIISATGLTFHKLTEHGQVHVLDTKLVEDYITSTLTSMPLEALGGRVLGHYAVFRDLENLKDGGY